MKACRLRRSSAAGASPATSSEPGRAAPGAGDDGDTSPDEIVDVVSGPFERRIAPGTPGTRRRP